MAQAFVSLEVFDQVRVVIKSSLDRVELLYAFHFVLQNFGQRGSEHLQRVSEILECVLLRVWKLFILNLSPLNLSSVMVI
jgi:hypothetical protein